MDKKIVQVASLRILNNHRNELRKSTLEKVLFDFLPYRWSNAEYFELRSNASNTVTMWKNNRSRGLPSIFCIGHRNNIYKQDILIVMFHFVINFIFAFPIAGSSIITYLQKIQVSLLTPDLWCQHLLKCRYC